MFASTLHDELIPPAQYHAAWAVIGALLIAAPLMYWLPKLVLFWLGKRRKSAVGDVPRTPKKDLKKLKTECLKALDDLARHVKEQTITTREAHLRMAQITRHCSSQLFDNPNHLSMTLNDMKSHGESRVVADTVETIYPPEFSTPDATVQTTLENIAAVRRNIETWFAS